MPFKTTFTHRTSVKIHTNTDNCLNFHSRDFVLRYSMDFIRFVLLKTLVIANLLRRDCLPYAHWLEVMSTSLAGLKLEIYLYVCLCRYFHELGIPEWAHILHIIVKCSSIFENHKKNQLNITTGYEVFSIRITLRKKMFKAGNYFFQWEKKRREERAVKTVNKTAHNVMYIDVAGQNWNKITS